LEKPEDIIEKAVSTIGGLPAAVAGIFYINSVEVCIIYRLCLKIDAEKIGVETGKNNQKPVQKHYYTHYAQKGIDWSKGQIEKFFHRFRRLSLTNT
jgi:hypothetical protein